MGSLPENVQAAIGHLKDLGIVIEPGLTDDEVGAVEAALGTTLPAGLRLFLQAALPVTGGFPNWRHADLAKLPYHSLERPARGILFDVEHNGLWPAAWDRRPGSPEAALAEGRRRLASAPPLIPIRPHHYLPAAPSRPGNPVLSVRQCDIRVAGRDLLEYLRSLGVEREPGPPVDASDGLPFWGELGGQPSVPDFAPASRCDHAAQYERLRLLAELHGVEVQTGHGGWWQGGWPAIWFSRPADLAGDGRPRPLFGFFLRDAGWLLNGCPFLHFLPDRERVEELCLALFSRWPRVSDGGLRSPRLRMDEDLRTGFGLVAVAEETVRHDAEEARAGRLERLGWRAMADREVDDAWARYAGRFGYPAGGRFRTPTPSVTWDISPTYLLPGEEFVRVEEDLTRKALSALSRCTRPGEELHALDWNHPCYFLDPHGGVADTGEPWPVPVLPNGDHHIFLASDFRFGIVGDCVEQTVCVFGQTLLDALAAEPPLAFRKRALAAEGREALRAGWAALGWRRLSCDERDEYRDGFYEAFGFSAPTFHGREPCFREPRPSLTWDISGVLRAAGGERESAAADLTFKLLAAFRGATPAGETLLVLDVLRFYEHYAFDPHRLASASREQWAQPVVPDDNFSVFLTRDFRFGVVGDPVRRTLCVFGQPLLDAFLADLPACLVRVVRQDGSDVDRPLIIPGQGGEG